MPTKIDPSFRDNLFPTDKKDNNGEKEVKLSRKGEIIKLLRDLRTEYISRIKDERRQLDIVFKREFFSDFEGILNQYTNGSFLDDKNKVNIDSIIQSVLSSDIKDNLIQQIYDVIETTIEKVKSVSVLAIKKIRLNDVLKDSSIIDRISVNKTQVSNIINNLFDSSSDANITKFKKRINDDIVRHTNNVAKKYEKLVGLILPKPMTKTQIDKIKKNSLFDPKKSIPSSFTITIDYLSKKKAVKLVDRLYIMINYGLLKRTFIAIGNFFEKTYRIAVKIVNIASQFTKQLVSGSFRIIARVFIVRLFKLMTKPLQLLYNTAILVANNLKKLIKKVNIGYFIMTPVGMYTLGFVSGLIWNGVKKLIGKIKIQSIEQIIDTVIDGVVNIWVKVSTYLHEKFPTIMGFVDWVFNMISGVLSPVFNYIKDLFESGGFLEIVNKLIDDTVDVVKKINDSWIGNLVSFAINIGKWLIGHPKTTSIIYSIAKAFQKSSMIRQILKSGKTIFNAAVSGGFFNMLISGFVSYGVATVVEAIMTKFFTSRTDEAFNVLDNDLSDLYQVIDQHDRSKFVSTEHGQNSTVKRIHAAIIEQSKWLTETKILLKDAASVLTGRRDMPEGFIPLVNDILNQPWVSDKDREEYNRKSNAKDKIEFLTKDILKKRVKQMVGLQNAMNFRSNKFLTEKNSNGESFLDQALKHFNTDFSQNEELYSKFLHKNYVDNKSLISYSFVEDENGEPVYRLPHEYELSKWEVKQFRSQQSNSVLVDRIGNTLGLNQRRIEYIKSLIDSDKITFAPLEKESFDNNEEERTRVIKMLMFSDNASYGILVDLIHDNKIEEAQNQLNVMLKNMKNSSVTVVNRLVESEKMFLDYKCKEIEEEIDEMIKEENVDETDSEYRKYMGDAKKNAEKKIAQREQKQREVKK